MPSPRDQRDDPATLRRSIEHAIGREHPRGQIVAMLERLQRVAQEGTDDRRFAERRLAELLLEAEPWRAATLVRRLLRDDDGDDACWALMGLSQALLGHHRYAAAAYRRALAIDPGNPWYAHNLGHLLDVALDRPRDALAHLRRSTRALPDEPAIACSLAHALFRVGDRVGARRALAAGVAAGGARDPDVVALAAELERDERAARKASRARGAPQADRAIALEHRALVRKAGATLELSPSRCARALEIVADFLRAQPSPPAVDAPGRALLAGAAVLAIGRVDGVRPLPIDAVAEVLAVERAALLARARQVVDALAIVKGDPRYRRKGRAARALL